MGPSGFRKNHHCEYHSKPGKDAVQNDECRKRRCKGSQGSNRKCKIKDQDGFERKILTARKQTLNSVRELAAKASKQMPLLGTEEATKNALVMPFIQALGYNVFDPAEVVPEFTADVGTKKGEKVDYAILKDGKPIILFECKKAGGDLSINHAGQLFRYFHVTAARFGVLTNGLVYRFFTDLEQPNKMDEKPFFEFNILDFKERDVEELKKFAKAAFDLDTILTTANDLKYTRAIQNRLAEWMISPSEEFVRLVSTELLGAGGLRRQPKISSR